MSYKQRPQQNQKRNKSLGPKYKINVPQFQFEQADNEEKLVDNIIDAHRQNKINIIKLGNQIRETEKLPIIQQKKIFQQPKYKNETNFDKMRQQYIQNNDQIQIEKLTQQACQVFGTKNPKRNQNFQQNLKQTRNLQSAVFRNNNSSIQVKRSKRGISEYRDSQNDNYNNNNFQTLLNDSQSNNVENQVLRYQLNNQSNTQKIDSNRQYQKRDSSLNLKLPEMVKNNKYMQAQFQSEQFKQSITQSPDKQSIRHSGRQSMQQSRGGSNSPKLKFQNLEKQNQEQESNFNEKGHNCQKNLKDYDLYQEIRTPQQWVEFYKNKKPPHGISPVYMDKQYKWTDIELIGYDEKTKRFKVKLLFDGSYKQVVRLSLMFLDEKRDEFMGRVGNAKELQYQAEDEMRFKSYVESQPNIIASLMSEQQKQNIQDKLITCKHHYSEQQLQNDELMKNIQEKIEQANKSHKKEILINHLMKIVLHEYQLFQKKQKVIDDMKYSENDKKWKQLHIKNRYVEKVIPVFGTIEQLKYNYESYQESFKKSFLQFDHPLVIKCLNNLQTRIYQLRNHNLFNYNYKSSELPMSLEDYIQNQQSYHISAHKQINLQFRDYAINEIQDRLKKVYSFYIFRIEEYNETNLQRFLKLVDFITTQFFKQTYIETNLKLYCDFIKQFTRPSNDSKHFQGLWSIQKQPLIYINLIVEKDFKKKKEHSKKENSKNKQKDQKKEQSKNEKQEENQQQQQSLTPIYFSPSIEEIKNGFLKPFELLIQSNKTFLCLEKDLVPLINTNKLQSISYDIDLQHKTVQNCQQMVLEYLNQGFQEPLEILEKFNEFQFLFDKSVSSVVRNLFPTENTKEIPKIMDLDPILTEEKIERFFQAQKKISMYTCIDNKNGQLFQVRTQSAKELLVQKCQEFISTILKKIENVCADNCKRIHASYTDIEQKLQVVPVNEQEMVELQLALEENELNLSKLALEVKAVEKFLGILEKYYHIFDDEKSNEFWLLMSRPSEIMSLVADAKNTAQKVEDKLLEKLEKEKTDFNMEIKEMQGELMLIKQFKDYDDVKQNSNVTQNLMDRINKANFTIKNFNEREAIFKQLGSEYPDLKKVIKEFEPYHNLWETCINFVLDKENWLIGSFFENQYSKVEKKIQSYFVDSANFIKLFNNQLEDYDTGEVAKFLKQDIEEFKKNLWIVELLTVESLLNVKKSQTHWKEVIQRCGLEQQEVIVEELTFQRLLDLNFQDHRDVLEDVSNKAEKQWQIEKKLKEMEEKTKEQNLELMPFKNTGSYVLKSLDDLQQLLDDQLNVLMMMKSSPYMKPLIKMATQFEFKIVLIIDTLEECLKCQRAWMYLEPIFSSEDITKKLPMEKRMFDKVDNYWRDTMFQFQKDQSVWENIDTEKMKNDFKSHNITLEEVQKSLSEYLETKRRYFPRFYFLSDEELLEILADTKDPLKVQKHINKCFEAIFALNFNDQNQVQGMISAEGEKVMFQTIIDVNEGDRKGNVEIWLLEIEHLMQKTLIDMTQDCMSDNQDRNNWLLSWPGQLILGVDMLRWTNSAECAIQNSKAGQIVARDWENKEYIDLKAYRQHLENQLLDVVKLVRTDLNDLARLTLGALVTLDVHAKDVIQDLEQRQCKDPNDFQWLSQLRYEWQETKKEKILWVKMINAKIKYGFEYLGNSSRLVITPLTDRCYRTLMGAKHLQYGGAPEGPAGTGKTETVKDLAKALAVQCVVFNCSDGLNYLAMRKFFKGLASSGAWCCFDEFNRIDLEVLSVIAQQVLTIQEAVKERKKVFLFEDEDIPLIDSCAVNITMNPGYAGRSELPDNLKALFRPCAMMVPDYAMISEIFLYSVGFTDARNLARKVVASLRLSSEQLSSQDHYDFGMRAVKAILTAAGNLKRQMIDEIEDIVCLRALMDVNLPKFTINDVPLFMSITSDLFPGVKIPEKNYGLLKQSLLDTCDKTNLQPLDTFITKCIQLYDTINVRHGLMVVGSAYSGKSGVIKTLQQSISDLKGQEKFQDVIIKALNPKAVTSDQLFGKLDPDTKAWSDGVVAIIMREASSSEDKESNKWILFDGPVDAVWIENMNTVLDDNKKLCLTSGEIIKMSPVMRMMFEVEDLAVASPATVSRCGMVFLETKSLGFECLIKSYIKELPEQFGEINASLQEKCKYILDASKAWCFNNANMPIHKNFNAIVATCLKYFETFVKPFRDLEYYQKNNADLEENLYNQLLFSIAWGVGGSMEEQTRSQYDIFLRHVITGDSEIPEKYDLKLFLEYEYQPQTIKAKFPEKDSIFLLSFDTQKKWINWTSTEKKYQVPQGGDFHQIFVPTSDSIRNKFFLHLSVQNQIHTLFTGPTGTGKTANIMKEINENYFNTEYTNLCTAFSGQTGVNQVQKQIESKVNSRRRKGVYGPEDGKKFIVIFIDDLNMPQKEVYGAQPPIELLRQWMDTKSVFDLETREQKQLIDMIFISAMLPSGQPITLRFLRHFNIIYVESFEKQSLVRIFSNILEWYFLSQEEPITNNIKVLKDKVVQSTIELYQKIQKSEDLLPTPAKSHYLYNLRDLSKVFQGISKTNHHSFKDEVDFIRLWIHECQRVFQDRLINVQDQEIFQVMLKDMCIEKFQRDWNDILPQQPTLWASFVPVLYPMGDTTKPKLEDVYCEIKDHNELKKKTYEYLEEYNNFYSANRMNLVLFMDAIQHIIKIVRVITTTYGHCLLVGVGGSGRKSLATLSSFIATMSEPQVIDENNRVEELQRIMKMAGLEEKPVIFMYTDTQILKESNVEEICNILNNGEIPELFPNDEKAKILEDISIQGTPNEKYNYFVSQCKKNLHMVLAFSPVGDQFRRRLRTFPTLVNCTTIDWFLPWPQEALRSTASAHFDKEMNIQDQKISTGLEEIVVDMQTRVQDLTIRYKEELRKFYYVTPTSYLDLLQIFKKLVLMRQEDMVRENKRYETGVKKIVETEGVIEVMQKELEDLQPLLKEKTEKNDTLLQELKVQQKQADGERKVCEIDEEKCNIQRNEANTIREDCQNELDKVVPLLDNAAKALEKITKDDMTFLRSFQKPPEPAVLCIEGLVIAFNEDQNVKLVPKKDSTTNEKVKDYWEYAKKKVLNDKLMKRVLEFREDSIRNITDQKIQKLKQLMQNPLLEKEKVMNASKAAGNLTGWLRAVVDTHHALLVVDPKKQELAVAESKLSEAEKTLKEKKDALQKVLDELQLLQDNFDQAANEKQQLQQKIETCQVQLQRADKLINGLANEKISWAEKAENFKEQQKTVIGDCLLCSGIIAYMGAFPIAYRDQTIQIWQDMLKKYEILYSENFSLQNILSDPIQIGQWTQSQKLPNDSFSIDNAIILKNSHKFPLMIDPQQQANQWIRKMENNRQLNILRPSQSQKELSLKLENCIQFGYPVLLENLGENIDNIFESILQKKLVKVGGVLKIKFQEKILDYSKDFMLYLTTKLPKPHYAPEICVKVTLLNFQVTVEGLEDQMLNIVVQNEEPIKDKQRQQNIEDFFNYKNQQKETENLILKLLNESEGNLLDDDQLIQTLETSKIESKEIEDALQKQEHFSVIFNQIRDSYRSVAVQVSNMYFVILDLAFIEPTYQWSLEFYINLFLRAIQKAETGKAQRTKNINNKFMSILYEDICRSLLEKDKQIFSFLLCLKSLEIKKKITSKELRFLMIGGTSTEASKPIPEKAKSWLSYKQWCTLLEMQATNPEIYKNFIEDFENQIEDWEKLFNDPENYINQWPGVWNNLEYFQKLAIIRTIFTDKFARAVDNLIEMEMGQQFIQPPLFNLKLSIQDATPFTPLVFVLSSGADPRLEIINQAEEQGQYGTFMQISLGQGQGELAEKSIKNGIEQGSWVLLQNCHLAPSFMPTLDLILENMELKPENVHDGFRIWLTTMPSEVFPASILMKSIKMTFEPPRGLKNNLQRSFQGIENKFYESSQKPQAWKKLFFGLAFFHALIIERRQFGPLGWNIPYEFTSADFNISFFQLKMFMDEYEQVPYEALNYMVAEANYGGRVTDTHDRRLIKIILNDFYDPKILNDDYKFSESGKYYAPAIGDLVETRNFISQLPNFETAEVFGLHSNASISSAIMETNRICDTVLSLLPRESAGAGEKPEDIVENKIKFMLSKLPQPFDTEKVNKLHPVRYDESMNTVLQQELIRFNKLLIVVIKTLKDLSKAIKGLLVMNQDLEKLFNSIFDNKIPDLWAKVSYPSLKPMGAYLNDLIERLNYMQNWIEKGAPANFWISGFYFTQSFLTGVLQNFARKYQVPIDTLEFEFSVVKEGDNQININKAPEDGCYIHGLYMEGARWDNQLGEIQESVPKQLYSKIPYIYLLPSKEKLNYEENKNVYQCPVYKTTARKGTLSTTGHSTNYVMSMFLKIAENQTSQHWVKRGVAAITQLDD